MSALESLKVRGPFRGGSGHDYHTRSFVREFVDLGVAVELEEFTEWSLPLPADLQETFFDTLDVPVASTVQVQFVMPHQVSASPGARVANYTMFEASRIPAAWAARAEACDLIIVPTTSSLDAWLASGIKGDRLRRCPLGVRRAPPTDLPPLPLRTQSGRLLATYEYRFLNLAEMIPRKNQLGLIEAWLMATTPADDAVLILKLNQFRHGLAERFQADLRAVFERVGRTPDDCAPIHMITEYLPDAQMHRLYRAATHYISLSFGEGWDLPMTEAAAAGLTLVAPRHTAYLDYLNDANAHLISCDEVSVAGRDGALARVDAELFEGLTWWMPDLGEATSVIREIIDGRAPHKSSPRDSINERYAWPTVARQLLDVLDELA